MKPLFEKVAMFLVTLGSVAFIYNLYTKISEGKAFERYRTVWLFETDYFSVAFALVSILLFSIIYIMYNKLHNKKEINDAKNELEKRRSSQDK